MRTLFRTGSIILYGLILLLATMLQAQSQDTRLSKRDSIQYVSRVKKLANGDKNGRWPTTAPMPLKGAILPFSRVVAYYGNLYSRNMGILGELPKDAMLAKLKEECKRWQQADSTTPVVPALHYIAVTAQGAPGKDGMYRLRMPDSEIDKIVKWTREIKGIAFLDIQTGHSSVAAEVLRLEKYLKMPDVHLGIDPEYSMKNGGVPSTSIGTFDAADINAAVDFLAALVRKYKLPPKILVVHRFTQNMITNYKAIRKVPEVQIVIDMDGFGAKPLKRSTYMQFVAREPVQFTGFKLFYHQDKPVLYTPAELLKLVPIPIYIQYQ